MNSTIDQKIDESIAQIDYFLKKLPPVKAKLYGYAFPNISITDLKQTGGGLTYANIDIDVRKDPAEYTQAGKIKEFKVLHDYWTWAVKEQLKEEGMLYTVKSAALLEFKENIINNYSSQDEETVDNLAAIIDETIDALKDAKEQEQETDMYHVLPPSLRKLDPALKKASSIRIAKLVSGLIFDPDNYERLKNIRPKDSCTFSFLKQVLYE